MQGSQLTVRACLALLLLACAAGRTEPQISPAAPAPNLVVITLDTVRADHLECYGYKLVKTPRINSLAADGILVERAYSPIPLTLPSHASLFTGTYPVFHGVRDFTGYTLGLERTTLAEMLKSVGYRTGAVLGSAVLEARWGVGQGFDFYYDNFPAPTAQNWQTIAERRGDEVVDVSLRWLEQNSKSPFFLWVHLYDPHDPYTPPPPFDHQYSARPYDGEIAFTDQNVGRVLDYLREKRLYDNTLIVLLGDHGESLGEHGEKTHGFFIYDCTLRIPLIFKLPGSAAPRGRRLAGPVRIIDVVPTVLRALALESRVRATEVQGQSAYSALLGKALPDLTAQAESMLPLHQFEWSALRSIRRGRFKYIDSTRPELYDTSADPGEAHNLYASNKAIAGQMKTLLSQDIARFSPKGGAVAQTPAPVDPATAEKLASLGYIAVSRGTTNLASGRSLPDPKDRVAVYNLITDGSDAARRSEYRRALTLLWDAVKLDPDNLVAHFQLGVVYRVIGELDKAEKEMLRTLELRPGYDLALRRLAEVYMAAGRYADAETAFKKVVELAPGDYLGYFNLGGLYVTTDRWDDALAAFRKAQSLNGRDVLIPVVLSRVLMKRGDLAGALEAIQRALELDPNLVAAHETAREIYQAMGRPADADRESRILEQLKKSSRQ